MALQAGRDAVGPPWTLSLEGLVWVHPAAGGVALTVGGFARYRDSPVGPYSEVWCSPSLAPALPIAFMAVDSEASMRAGRANWALPKETAAFSGWSAEGDGWSVAARVRSTGVRLPLLAGGYLMQVAEDGSPVRSFAWVRGVGRAVRVEVAVDGVAWLRAGRHAGVLVERATLTVRAPARRVG